MTTSTSTSATRGYRLHVVLAGFYTSHSIHAITTLQLRGAGGGGRGCQFIGFYLQLILQSHHLWCSHCDCGGGVRVYLVDYIFYIIDCHICRDIFGRIDIMYCRLSYVSKGVLPLKTLVLYIYRPRSTMQDNQQLYAIYSSNSDDTTNVTWARGPSCDSP
jgi:hypothetical protein